MYTILQEYSECLVDFFKQVTSVRSDTKNVKFDILKVHRFENISSSSCTFE